MKFSRSSGPSSFRDFRLRPLSASFATVFWIPFIYIRIRGPVCVNNGSHIYHIHANHPSIYVIHHPQLLHPFSASNRHKGVHKFHIDFLYFRKMSVKQALNNHSVYHLLLFGSAYFTSVMINITKFNSKIKYYIYTAF